MQCDPTSDTRAASGLRYLVTTYSKLFVNPLQITTGSFIIFTPKDFKGIVIYVSACALHTIATHAVVFKALRKLVSGKKFMGYKLLH
jgi:hypothetical protein